MREAEYCHTIFIRFSGDTLALVKCGTIKCVCFQVCEVQTSQSDVREGQHAIKGAAGKVSLLVGLVCLLPLLGSGTDHSHRLLTHYSDISTNIISFE